ncbi:MAG: hypothetical protein GY854_24350 [Deltaproteobacteria bacterium]|nr:hypothetical protein [Deltaproteobacteria bacterium]
MSGCISQPISWLALEQYHLGDVNETEQQQIEHHLDRCPVCTADYDKLTVDTRTLKPLPELRERRDYLALLKSRPAVAATALLAAAALFVVILGVPFEKKRTGSIRPSRVAFKGGDLALMIARERNGLVMENPSRFAEGDSFRLFLTHPLSEPARWDVVVWQGEEIYFPFTDRPVIPSGNRVPVPGAFRLTESLPVNICLMIGDDIPSREALERDPTSALPEATVCVQLETSRP